MSQPSPPEAPRGPHGAWVFGLWASLGLWDGYRLIPAEEPVLWAAWAAEAVLFALIGAIVLGLPSFPAARHPIWPLAVALFLLLARDLTPDAAGAMRVVAAFALAIPPAWALVRRGVRVPVLAVALTIPLALAVSDRLRDGDVARWTWPLASAPLPPASEGTPVVILSIDTLRADDAQAMTTWKRLSAEGTWWPSAASSSSWTMPSLGTLMTGVTLQEHGSSCEPMVVPEQTGRNVLPNLQALPDQASCTPLRADVPTLAEELSAAGYQTTAVVSNPWTSRHTGFHRGFQRFRDVGNDPVPSLLAGPVILAYEKQSARSVLDRAHEELARLGDRSFLWVHLIDPHWPYLHAEVPLPERLQHARTPETRATIREAYRHEIAVLDGHLQAFLDAVDARWGGRALVVFTSDHGEEFWEHDGVEHGHSHHAEVVEVPLVVRGPGFTPGRRDDPVGLIDIAPTVRAAAGLPPRGQSLSEPRPMDRPVQTYGTIHGLAKCSARDGQRRVIFQACHAGREPEGYDLGVDPGELHPLAVPADDGLRPFAWQSPPAGGGVSAELGVEALQALGYLE